MDTYGVGGSRGDGLLRPPGYPADTVDACMVISPKFLRLLPLLQKRVIHIA